MTNFDDAPVIDAPDTAMSVPVIDLSQDAAAVVHQIGSACRDWGFFQIVGHGVDSALIDRAMAATRHFFALPYDAKRALLRSRDNPWGYYDRELTKNVRDKKEIFDIGPETPGAIMDDDPFAGQTPWPTEPSDFKPVMRDYFAACEHVAARLIDAVSRSLGGPRAICATPLLPPTRAFCG
ncbi:MAG: 2-oxoglutarate and iron-dependent oxygenase domain-containing protein [Sphingomonas sp.]